MRAAVTPFRLPRDLGLTLHFRQGRIEGLGCSVNITSSHEPLHLVNVHKMYHVCNVQCPLHVVYIHVVRPYSIQCRHNVYIMFTCCTYIIHHVHHVGCYIM
jgi:hypothetical protein